jgi:hypothetical protein
MGDGRMTNRHAEAIAGVLAGTTATAAYLTGTLVGYLTRHPTPLALLALAIAAAHASQHPRRWTALGHPTA